MSSSPAISANGAYLYFGCYDYYVYKLNALDGTKLWRFPTGFTIHGSPVLSNDESALYVGGEDSSLYAISTAGLDTTDKLWSLQTGGGVESSPVLSRGGAVVYAGSGDGHLYAASTPTGSQRWRCATNGSVNSSPALSGDGKTVYVGSDDGKLYAVNAEDGVKMWASEKSFLPESAHGH